MLALDVRKQLARDVYNEAVKAARQNPTAFAWARLLGAAKNLRKVLVELGPDRAQPSDS